MTQDISILLPTRGRTQQLERSVNSLIESAKHADRLEWRLAFDRDDASSSQYFLDHVLPKIESSGAIYTCMEFDPMGYANLHQYVNALAKDAQGDWFVFWNDDAVMLDKNWDSEIRSYTGQFVVQAFDTHRQHPYSIFPIVPRDWFGVLGYLSQHQLNDAWISQIAWMLDIMIRLPIRVEHDRFDLTGNNKDRTFMSRTIFEGNPADPRDFNHKTNWDARIKDTMLLANWMQSQGMDTQHWQEVCLGQRDPWEKMMAADVNRQMKRL